MNSVYLLTHECGEYCHVYYISAHPTMALAKSAERFFRGYDQRFTKFTDTTDITEVDFST